MKTSEWPRSLRAVSWTSEVLPIRRSQTRQTLEQARRCLFRAAILRCRPQKSVPTTTIPLLKGSTATSSGDYASVHYANMCYANPRRDDPPPCPDARGPCLRLKEIRPDVPVLGCGTVLPPRPYLEGIFQHGGLKHMDRVVIHPYRGSPDRMPVAADRLAMIPVQVAAFSGPLTVSTSRGMNRASKRTANPIHSISTRTHQVAPKLGARSSNACIFARSEVVF